MRAILAAASLLTAALLAPGARAEPPPPTPLDDLGPNVVRIFSGTNLLFEAGAFAVTGAMAYSGADHRIRVGFQEHLASGAYGDAANFLGYAIPAVGAPFLWLVGAANGDPELTGAGSAVIQAVLVTLGTTGALKVATGRPYPLHGGDPRSPDKLNHPEYAHEFSPFQNKLASWPSGHTAVTISMAAALTGYAPDSPWVPFVGYPLALAIGIGMIDGDHHWASDVVAGAVFGHIIGYSIGRDFRRRRDESLGRIHDNGVGWQVIPLAGPVTGVALATAF